MNPLTFSIEKVLESKPGSEHSLALGRAGVLETPHGTIRTPAFITVGTKATVKALTPEQVRSTGAEVVLANTYHLYLEPGAKRVKEFGGLHKFMNWQGPMMTDSGGFQVFSLGAAYGKELGKVTKITDPAQMLEERSAGGETPRLAEIGSDGVSFRSHLDGSLHYITPEKSIEIQHDLGADIIFAFDECTSPAEDFRYQEEALERTHRWAHRSLEVHKSKVNSQRQALFAVIQGGREEVLRKRSAKILSEMRADQAPWSQGDFTGFDGYGIGGSFAKEDMETAVKWVNEILPPDKPRHLLGIGEPEDLFMGVENGVDLFDCVTPTRNGRQGTLYTSRGKINISNAEYRDDKDPIDPECTCPVCQGVNLSGRHPYTRGYICHLYRSKEMLAGTLGSMHNLYFIINLVKRMRASILDNTFYEFKKEFLSLYKT